MSLKELIKFWPYSFILCIGLYFCFPVLPPAIFSKTIVSSENQIKVWRLSTNKNILELTQSVEAENSYFTESPITKLYIGFKDLSPLGKLTIEFNETDKFIFQIDAIERNWHKAVLPEQVKTYEGMSIFEVPSKVMASSTLHKIYPIINWSLLNFSFSGLFIIILASVFLTPIIFIATTKTQSLSNRYSGSIPFIIPVLGFVASCFFISQYGVNFYWMDSLAFYNLASLNEADKINWQALWAQHNEHRILLVRIIYLFISIWKPFNLLILTYVNQLLILIATLFLIFKIKNLKKSNTVLLSLLTTYFFFTPAHMENTLLPFHGQWHGFMIGSVLVLVIASDQKYFMKSALLWVGLFAAYASMPTWVCLPMTIISAMFIENISIGGEKIQKSQLKHFFMFGCITILMFAYYMKGWVPVSVSPLDGFFTDTKRFFIFFFQMLGNQISQPQIAMLSGFIIFSFGLWLIYKKIQGKIYFPTFLLYLFFFSINWSLITAIGRSTAGSAAISRYAFISTGIWLSILSVILLNWNIFPGIIKKVYVFGLLVLFSLQNLIGFSNGRGIYRVVSSDFELVKKAMLTNNPAFLKHSQINPTIDLVNNAKIREDLLSQYKFLIAKGYWVAE